MKRSKINAIITESEAFMAKMQFSLPAWSRWSHDEWLASKALCRQVFDCQLGWDITDFGLDDFRRRGLVLFTLRNGLPDGSVKTYAEKIMIVGENQETPFHFHRNKREDIINRGGGVLVFELHMSTRDETLSDEDVVVYIDGVESRVPAGEPLELLPGQSLTLETFTYHRFYGKVGYGPVLTGEVSSVNDDAADNRFLEDLGRFPDIIEDEEPYRLLVGDYQNL
jgi:D-lyxose ketol-isomerase